MSTPSTRSTPSRRASACGRSLGAAPHRLRGRLSRLGLPRGRRRERPRRGRAHAGGGDDEPRARRSTTPCSSTSASRRRTTPSATASTSCCSTWTSSTSWRPRSRSSRSTGGISSRCARADHLGDPQALDPRQPARLARFARRQRARRPHRAAHARAHVRVRLQPRLVLLRAQPRRHAGVRRGRGAQHVRRALAVPARRAGRARRRWPHALQHREALPRLAVHGRLRHLPLPARRARGAPDDANRRGARGRALLPRGADGRAAAAHERARSRTRSCAIPG